MKFRKFGKTLLTAAISSAIVFSLSSCVRSFTVGYLYVTGTVTGTPANNGIISGFKIDNDTGKLVSIHLFPIGSGGANPVRAVLLSGGRFVYVLNQGTPTNGSFPCNASNPCLNPNITQFAVGGNGILTPQETFYTQGSNPFRLTTDSTGAYMFALDHDAPSNAYCSVVFATAASGCGDITVFSINSSTGRLSLVTNAQLTSSAGTAVTYYPVPADPIDFTFTSSYVMTLAGAAGTGAAQVVYPYTYTGSTGALTLSESSPQKLNATVDGATAPAQHATAIVPVTGKILVLDNEATVAGNGPGQILDFTVGSSGALNAITGSPFADDPAETSPIYAIVESKGRFLYVANQHGASSSSGAGVAGFSIDASSGQLTEAPGSPWGVGTEPVCLLQDPSDQFIYTANAGDSTITGKLLDPNSGQLDAMRGSTGTFALSGPATWCVATGRTN